MNVSIHKIDKFHFPVLAHVEYILHDAHLSHRIQPFLDFLTSWLGEHIIRLYVGIALGKEITGSAGLGSVFDALEGGIN